MDRGGGQNKRGTHTVHTNTQTFANKTPETFNKKKTTNQQKKKNYNKACITIPTEDNTDEEKRGC